ncbi:MAG: hypothetical protein ACKN85_11145 [Pirellula sp.]
MRSIVVVILAAHRGELPGLPRRLLNCVAFSSWSRKRLWKLSAYLLGLAHSSAGKDWPRKLNTRILFEIGAAGCLGERFSSGERIQYALYLSPTMLFQTDEIDGILQSMSTSRDGRHENLMSTLLTMYSSANSVYPMRRKAGKESSGAPDGRPGCLSVNRVTAASLLKSDDGRFASSPNSKTSARRISRRAGHRCSKTLWKRQDVRTPCPPLLCV